MFALDIKNVNVKIGEFQLRNISFNVPKGSIVGLVGRNGAGKTTLINTIANCIGRESGTILYDGLTYWNHEEDVKKKLGVVFDQVFINQQYSPMMFRETMKKCYENFNSTFFDELIDKFDLPVKKKIAKYSSGMKHKFMLVAVMSMNPETLILDEPTSGVDPADRYAMMDLFQTYMEDEKHTILFSTHITSDLDKIADYLVFIDQGKIVFAGEKDEILESFRKVKIPIKLMNDKMKENLFGLKSTVFYWEALCSDSELWNLTGIESAIPNVEDIIVNLGEIHRRGDNL